MSETRTSNPACEDCGGELVKGALDRGGQDYWCPNCARKAVSEQQSANQWRDRLQDAEGSGELYEVASETIAEIERLERESAQLRAAYEACNRSRRPSVETDARLSEAERLLRLAERDTLTGLDETEGEEWLRDVRAWVAGRYPVEPHVGIKAMIEANLKGAFNGAGLLSISLRPDLPIVELVARFDSLENAQAARDAFTRLVVQQVEPSASYTRAEFEHDRGLLRPQGEPVAPRTISHEPDCDWRERCTCGARGA